MGNRIEMLVTVKSYPALSKKYGEVVCVAGVRTDTPTPEWVRLFPVAYRDMAFTNRFKKYQRISVDAERHSGDRRPETYRPALETITTHGDPLPSKRDWVQRRPFIDPLLVESMCETRRRQKLDGTSLAAFRPSEVLDLIIDDDVSERKMGQAAVAAQPTLFFQNKDELEQIPVRFRYRYKCSTKGCKGHTQSMIDWEIGASWRSWRERYDEPTLIENLRKRFLEEMCGPGKDTIFFVGSVHRYPTTFLVLGVFWPKLQVNDGDAR
jgi:hypothetical protein